MIQVEISEIAWLVYKTTLNLGTQTIETNLVITNDKSPPAKLFGTSVYINGAIPPSLGHIFWAA